LRALKALGFLLPVLAYDTRHLSAPSVLILAGSGKTTNQENLPEIVRMRGT